MEQTKECVVYKITNNKNGRIYIGVTVNFKRRMLSHKNRPMPKMIEDIKKYNWKIDFNKEVIWEGTEIECYEKEIELISSLNPEYNTSSGGYGGNGQWGEDKYNSSISNIEAMEIRYLYKYADDYNQKYLSILYNTSDDTISRVVRGIGYKKALGPISDINNNQGEDNSKSILKEKDIIEIRIRAKNTSDSYTEISKDYPTNKNRIWKIVNGTSWYNSPGPILGKDYEKRPIDRNTKPTTGSKITIGDILDIRERAYMTKDSYTKIAEDYPIKGPSIDNVVKGRAHFNIGGKKLYIDYERRGQGSE